MGMVVSRDDCEAVQRCFITGDPLLLPARFSACQSLQSATSRIQGHSDALSLSFSPFSACESIIIVCVPLLWRSNLLFHTGLLYGALSFVDLPDWHGCSEARQKTPRSAGQNDETCCCKLVCAGVCLEGRAERCSTRENIWAR